MKKILSLLCCNDHALHYRQMPKLKNQPCLSGGSLSFQTTSGVTTFLMPTLMPGICSKEYSSWGVKAVSLLLTAQLPGG
jgi:hypothetical protein